MSVFVNMAFVDPRPGKKDELAEVMRAFAGALQGQPGLVASYVLTEKGAETLVGVSIWTDEAAFQQGMAAARPAPPRSPIETLRERTPTVRQFAEV